MKKIGLALIALCAAMGMSGQAAEPPNVLLIVADDLGWRDTHCYGSSFYSTPNIDRLATQGVRFTNAYSAHAACSPTRSSILTGQYPARTGFTSASGHLTGKKKHQEIRSGNSFLRALGPSSVNYLDTAYYTLGEAMKDAGYATSFFGKWHLGHKPYIPENHGFDYVKGGRWHSGPPGADPKRKFFPPWRDCETLDSNLPDDTHVDDYITDLAIEFMAQERDEPFFMCFWPYSVHAPFQSKPELIEEWKKRVDPNNPQRSPTMAAMIEVLDENVGRLMEALERNHLVDNTVVLFLSDNGGNMYNVVDGTTPTNNAPLRGGKVSAHEGGVRIPFIARWPGVTNPGSVNDAVISTVDLYATVLEITGQPLRPEDHKDSVSFVPALRGKPFDRGPMICDNPQFASFVGNIPNTFVRDGKWKLYRYWFDSPDQTHRHELYDLDEDLGEARNVAEAYPEICQRLIEELDAYYEESGVLSYRPNEKYHHRRVKQWETLSNNGKAVAHDGIMTLQSDQPGFGIRTPIAPHMSTAIFTFDARSSAGTPATVQWTSKAHKKISDERAETVSLTDDWQTFNVRMDHGGINKGSVWLTLPDPGQVQLRGMQLSTPEGTVMMKYDLR